jgi:hypothetical protein
VELAVGQLQQNILRVPEIPRSIFLAPRCFQWVKKEDRGKIWNSAAAEFHIQKSLGSFVPLQGQGAGWGFFRILLPPTPNSREPKIAVRLRLFAKGLPGCMMHLLQDFRFRA